MTFKEILSEINAADLAAVKRRLTGGPHRWVPAGGGAYRFTTALCTKCNMHASSGKDFCDTEGLVKFWVELRNRRDCDDIQRDTI